MFQPIDMMQRTRGIAFIGNYLPRVCGIATFTYDLAEAVARHAGKDQPVIVAAMNDNADGYAYPDRVKFEVRQDYQLDYSRAADFLNFSHIDVICLQHEYGIFGGDWGSNLLALVRDLNRPIVMTCHTVGKDPDPRQKEVFCELAARATKLVVMSERAVTFLTEIYGVDSEKIFVIPHGIHDVPFIDPNYYKDKFGVEGRNMLLTFGLLHKNKGIEYMIEALPAIVKRHPKTTYLVLGATHPHVVASEGEAYRFSLQRRIRELGLEEHVLFHPRFVELDELLEYIGASDICVTPYLNMDQITSGALSYALGSGKAVVSTPYWHAEELLADGRGRLVPVRDSAALSREILDLLDHPVELNAMRKRAYLYCRKMTWASVSSEYMKLFDEARSRIPKRYRMEDAAAALVAAIKHERQFSNGGAARLIDTYLGLLQVLIDDGRNPADGLDYTRASVGQAAQASLGKAVWAIGYMVSHGSELLAPAANDLFQLILPNADFDSLRACGYAILGAKNYLERFPGASDVRRYLIRHADSLEAGCERPDWIAMWNASDWPVAVQALIVAATTLERQSMRDLAKKLVGELIDMTSNGTVFLKWGHNPDEEEHPVTAATFIEALGAAYYDGRDRAFLKPIRRAADWFLGDNRRGEAVYQFATGGCYDAVTASGLNRNQGTEATAYCLIAFTTLHRLAGMDVSAGAEDLLG
ncbi:MAG: glycosyltransferase family 4 protein [bacterium]